MANGFLTSSPTERHGASLKYFAAGVSLAQRFTCPGSGTQEITEIGIWSDADPSATAVHLAIFEDDAANGNPGAIVPNSDSGEISWGASGLGKRYYTYGTKPQLTGGNVYWIAGIVQNTSADIDYNSTGGTFVWTNATSYPNFPTEAEWDGAGDESYDFGIYAVYQAAGGDTPITPPVGGLGITGIAPRNDLGMKVPSMIRGT